MEMMVVLLRMREGGGGGGGGGGRTESGSEWDRSGAMMVMKMSGSVERERDVLRECGRGCCVRGMHRRLRDGRRSYRRARGGGGRGEGGIRVGHRNSGVGGIVEL